MTKRQRLQEMMNAELKEINEIGKDLKDDIKHNEILKKMDEISNPKIKVTKDEILKTRDPKERIKLIRENSHLFNQGGM